MMSTKYDETLHLTAILETLHLRGLNSISDSFPKNGLVIYTNKQFVAAGFIRLVEPSYALIDSYITNPLIDASVRNEALDLLTTQILLLCKDLTLTKLLGFSLDNNTLLRSLKHGFVMLEHKVISIDLA